MKTFKTKLQVARKGDKIIAIAVDKPDMEIGESVYVEVSGRHEGSLVVNKITSARLMDITLADLASFIYATPEIFWKRVETASGSGQPGEKEIYFITFGIDWEEESLNTLDELDKELENQIIKVRKLSAHDEED